MPTKTQTDSPARLVDIDHNDPQALQALATAPTSGKWFDANQARNRASAAMLDLRHQTQRQESQVKGLHHDIAAAFRAGKDASTLAVKAAKHQTDAEALRQQHEHMQAAWRFLNNELSAAQRADPQFKAWQARRHEIARAYQAINTDAEKKFPLGERRTGPNEYEKDDPAERIDWRDRRRRALVSDILNGGRVG